MGEIIFSVNSQLRSYIFLVSVLVILFVTGIFLSPRFLSASNLSNWLLYLSVLGILAIGETFVLLVGEVDLSVGSVMASSMMIGVLLTGLIGQVIGTQFIAPGSLVTGGSVFLILITIGAATLIGSTNGFMVVKIGIPSLIVTLGWLYIGRALAYLLSGGHQYFLTQLDAFRWFGNGTILGIPVPFVIFALLSLISWAVLRLTVLGTHYYATGGNIDAAREAGINVDTLRIGAFVYSGFLAGVAGVIYSAQLASAAPQQAEGYALQAIAIALLGGTTLRGGQGGIVKTFLAALIVGLLTNILGLVGSRPWHINIIMGLIIVSSQLLYTMRGSE